ncbi:MAG TPA: hypothetical protein VM925_19720 [Labilithrix sp.]|nr:hypothetical protein [Labilithrix sp.]
MRTNLVLPLLVALVACGTSSERDGFTTRQPKDSGTAGPNDKANPDESEFDQADAGTGEVTDDNCTDEARRVYVVAEGNVLYSFEPGELKFTRIGAIDCASVDSDAAKPGTYTHSMSVDRSGTAWVNLSNGQTYKVSTKDASCSLTGTTFKNTKWSLVTMGFATDTASSSSESLYVVGAGINYAWDLGKIDPTTLKAQGVGTFPADFKRKAELTGTGDGRLFGFFVSDSGKPMVLAEIDKATAAVTKIIDVTGTGANANASTAYAFSFWGGDFWFYSATAAGLPSKVIRYKAATDKSQSVVLQDVGGFRISGAGVSTCAPTVPPVLK